MKKQKVAVAISGGVDSGLSLYLLLQQGYSVTPVHFKLYTTNKSNQQKALEAAQNIAAFFHFNLQVIDLEEAHQQQVVNYFIKSYQQGSIPNPCVMCNKKIKFGLFYDWAREQAFDYIATGHYAAIKKINGQNSLITAFDETKDQTYFLHQLKSSQLKKILFPMAEMKKNQVKKLAQQINLPCLPSESSDVCFLAKGHLQDFLEEHFPSTPGKVVDKNGQVVGEHQGLAAVTLGQRKGFYINAKWLSERSHLSNTKHTSPVLYVIGKNLIKKQLIVGNKAEASHKNFTLKKLSLINPQEDIFHLPKLLVQIRHTGNKIPCAIQKTEDQSYLVKIDQALQGISPGQFAVFYTPLFQNRYHCLGGGEII